MRTLRDYRWKPIVIAEALRDFGAIWYLDSSVFFTKANVSHVCDLVTCHRNVTDRPPMLPSAARDLREANEKHEDGWNRDIWARNLKECRKGQYLLHGYSGHGILSVTHPNVYTYFPTNPSQLKKQKAKIFDQSIINLVLANQFWYDRRYYVSEIVDFFRIERGGSQLNYDDQLGCIRVL
uniref:Uncharacterized protein n=1 Tax=Caenorhabditis japonica TaxID=281687 RepID=A0A8R1DPL2_CAEJA